MKWFIVVVLGLSAAVLAEEYPIPDNIPLDNTHKWVGRWKSTGRQEHFGDFMQALGLPNHDVHDPETTPVLWKEGDKFHHKIPHRLLITRSTCALSWARKGIVHTMYKYTELPDKDLEMEIKIPSYNKTVHDIFHVDGNELMKTFKVDQVVAKRWYNRVDNSGAEPAAK